MLLKEQVEHGKTGNFTDNFTSERKTKHFPQHKIWWVRFLAGVKQHSRPTGNTPVCTSWGVSWKSWPRQIHLSSCALGLVLPIVTGAAAAAWGAVSHPLPEQQTQGSTAQHTQVICIIDTKEHPAVQILSLQSGNLPFPSSSCSLFTPPFHPARLPPTHPSPSFIPTQALSLSSHQKPDTSIASLHLSALPATYLPLPQAESSMRNKDI